jgi:hypothetical protein
MRRSWVVVCAVAVVAALTPALADVGEHAQEAGDVRVPTGEEPRFETMLPADTALFASVRDVPGLLRKLKELPLYKLVAKEGFLEGIMPPEVLTRCRTFYETYVKPLGGILQGEVAFAVTEIDFIRYEPPQLLVLADVGGREGALKTYLEKAIYPWVDRSGSLERREVEVGGASFTRIGEMGAPAPGALFGVRGGVFMLTPGPDQQVLLPERLKPDPGKSLASNPWFVKVEQALSGADFIEYFSVGGMDRKARKYLIDEEDVPEDYQEGWGVFHVVSGFDPLEAVGVGMTFGSEGGGTTIRLVGDGPHGGIFGALARKPPVLKSLAYLDQETAVFFALNVGDLSQVYNDVVAIVQRIDATMADGEDRVAAFKEAVASLGQLLGMDVEKKLLPAFGGEVAIAGWIPGGLEVPPCAALIEIKDNETIGAFVDRVLELVPDIAGVPFEVERVTHEGVEIVSLKGVPQVTPAVAIVGDFLVVASKPSVIEGIVDTRAEGPRLGEADGYKQYVSSIPGDAAITLYVDAKRIADFAWPIFAARMGLPVAGAGGPDGFPDGFHGGGGGFSAIGLVAAAIGELRQALSPYGMKVAGDEGGITITTRSANGGLGSMPMLSAIMSMPIMLRAEAVGGFVEEEEFIEEEQEEGEDVGDF